MPSLHSKWTSYLLAVAFMLGIAGNALAATNPMTLKDLSQIVLGLKKEVDRLSKENKTLSKKLERIETLRYAEHTPSSAYQIGNSERLMKARLSEPVRVASLGTARVAETRPQYGERRGIRTPDRFNPMPISKTRRYIVSYCFYFK